ncbi:unnamed protein product, partial [Oikopleura dioica]
EEFGLDVLCAVRVYECGGESRRGISKEISLLFEILKT